MGKYLIIAEKADAGRAIAAVIHDNWGEQFAERKGYLEGRRYIVSWCKGHLIELAMPEEYDEKYKVWRAQDYPFIPEKWKYKVSEGCEFQFDVLKRLMMLPEVTGIINAGDAGREGELIFRLVYNQVGCKKPVRRLWASTTAADDIKDALLHMKPGEEYDSLYYAAVSRSLQDYLIGINASRKYSCEYGAVLSIGRVQTACLNMVVERDRLIDGFQKRYYYRLVFTDSKGTVFMSAPYETKVDAEKAAASCSGKPVMVTACNTVRKSVEPPMLFSTTALQNDAGKIFGFTPKDTSDAMQVLYDKHVQSYPRTSAVVISDAQRGTYPSILNEAADAYGWPRLNSPRIDRIVDNKKIVDHPAVTLTREFHASKISQFSQQQQQILMLVANRMLVCSAPAYEYDATKVVAECSGIAFEAKGAVTVKEGWRVYRKQIAPMQPDSPLPAYQKGEMLSLSKGYEVVEKETAPPPRFTAATLVDAMEAAGKKEMEADVERTGIGTDATRGDIVEKLRQVGYIEFFGKKNTVKSTTKGQALIDAVPDSLKKVDLTVDWENRMLEIRKAETETAKRMSQEMLYETKDFVCSLIRQFALDPRLKASLPQRGAENGGVGKCPVCGKPVREGEKSWFCTGYKEGCNFSIYKQGDKGIYPTLKHSGVSLTTKMVERLLEKGKTTRRKFTSQKSEKEFEAYIVLSEYQPGRFGLAFEFAKSKDKKKS